MNIAAYCDGRINPLHVALLHQYLLGLGAEILDFLLGYCFAPSKLFNVPVN